LGAAFCDKKLKSEHRQPGQNVFFTAVCCMMLRFVSDISLSVGVVSDGCADVFAVNIPVPEFSGTLSGYKTKTQMML
jgi:hypothetical protein